MCLLRQTTGRVLLITLALVATSQQARLPLNQETALVCLLNCLDGRHVALHHHWHIEDSVDDTLRDTLWGMIWTTSTISPTTWYGNVDNLLHGELLNALLWDQSHNFNDLVHDLRNVLNRHLRLAIWTQPPKITILPFFSQFLPRRHSNTRTWYPGHQRQRQDHHCRLVKTLLVDADGACHLQIGIGSPLRARSSIFVRNASLVAPSWAIKSARFLMLCPRFLHLGLKSLTEATPPCSLDSRLLCQWEFKHPQENSSLLKFLNTLSNSLQPFASVVAVTDVDQIVHPRGLISSVQHEETQALVLHSRPWSRWSLEPSLFLYNSTGENLSSSMLLTSQHSLVLITLVHTLCCFLQRHIPDSLVCGDLPSVSRFEQTTEGYDSVRSGSLWLMSRRPWPVWWSSRHPSLCCAAYISRSPPAGCTREYASCAHRETSCLSLKAFLSSRLRDSTTVWSAEAFNTTGKVVVRGKTSRVPSLFLSPALLCKRPHACSWILRARLHPRAPVRASLWRRISAEYCVTSCERLLCGKLTSAECFEASPPHLLLSSRAPSTSEPSRSLISSMSLARGTHHHVLDLALLHPIAWGTSSGTSAPASLCCLVTQGCSGTPSATLHHLSACCWLCSFIMGIGVPKLAVSLSSRPFGTCFIHHIQWFQCQLLPQNHGCRSIHGLSSILTSQTSGTHKPLGRIEITISRNTHPLLVAIFNAQKECTVLCRCTDLWHLESFWWHRVTIPWPTTSNADSSVFFASFIIAHVVARIVSVTRSTSCPSTTERKWLLSSRIRQHTVRDTKTRLSVSSAPPCTNKNFTPCNQPSLEGHAINAKTLFLVPSVPSNRHLESIPLLSGRKAPFYLPNPTHSSNTLRHSWSDTLCLCNSSRNFMYTIFSMRIASKVLSRMIAMDRVWQNCEHPSNYTNILYFEVFFQWFCSLQFWSSSGRTRLLNKIDVFGEVVW